MLAVRRQESPRKVFLYLYAVSDQDGLFELDAAKIARQTGLSRKTVYKAIALLQRVRVLCLVEARRGRGRHSLYRLRGHQMQSPKYSSKKSVTPLENKGKTLKHPKDFAPKSEKCMRSRKRGGDDQAPRPKRTTEDYRGSLADTVTLVMGARFYRGIMQAIRLGFESWELSEPIRDALEGFYGRRIDGASLAYARELRERIWAMRAEIEALARKGASPRRVCSFVAGRLAGVPERSRREVLKRTAQLITDVGNLERRIIGLKSWLIEREREYREGRLCARCGYVHSASEYHSGRRDDGGGLNCFGYARVKLEELTEHRKLKARTERCRQCGGSLAGGHVEGLCWRCYNCNVLRKGPLRVASPKDATSVAGPVLIGDLIATAPPNIAPNGLQLPSEREGVSETTPPDKALCQACKAAPATGYGYCDTCRKAMVSRGMIH